MTKEESHIYLAEVLGWDIIDGGKKISKTFEKKDFLSALSFVNDVGKISEEEGHHPDIHIFYNKVRIELWTHAIEGLSENDFILAAKIDAVR